MNHHPSEIFKTLYAEATDFFKKNNRPHSDAMTLVTSTKNGIPSARVVLLKGYTLEGYLKFYTNYNSQKAKELMENPIAQLLFFWPDLGRQIRILGNIEKTTEKESDQYWFSRTRESRLGAIASKQSAPLATLETFKEEVAIVTKKYEGKEADRPDNWGGFTLKPIRYEFWKDGEHRLHERMVYSLDPVSKEWKNEFLYP